ncbi:type II toxin-antitoxin system RelE/ParE family toxin [Pseudacidovorax sp. NFM-22]|uniref:type II toxin-antitoxin system RelE/ParE family toxin n=1 Tax=Pseudacidovorax sp. NFM-22 TaxID=2744469 RepID=UPI001F26BE05|nr:type II toxin-antitoxin system RelE/ParE family toxin [Pseudacidovorax sp. NFM-22]
MTRKPKGFQVLLTRGAEQDLESLYDYVAEADSVANARRLLDRITATLDGLAHMPERGSHPRELLSLGIKAYRQVLFKPYRIVYQVLDHRVVVHLIADGRRDMQTLLARRLLGR